MGQKVIYETPGLVTVSREDAPEAVRLRWQSMYHEGSGVRDAIRFAFNYVTEHGIENWIADVSAAQGAMKQADQDWIESEFNRTLKTTPVKKFVLVPPGPESDDDTAWLDEWQVGFRDAFGGRVALAVLNDPDEIRTFFVG